MPKICLIHPWVKDLPSALEWLRMVKLSGDPTLVWDDEAPDVLIATEWIHYRRDCFERFRRLWPKASLRAACFQEAIAPDFNLFDYAFGFGDADTPRFTRLLSPLDMFPGFLTGEHNNPVADAEEARAELARKTGFCNFLYSNANAHPMRDAIFDKLSEYRRVDSLGRHRNNVSVPGTGYGGKHKAECLDLKRPYKFSIAAENACFPGYMTEKLFTSLQARTVPVYWGDPLAAQEVNPACLINAADYPDLDALLERVKEVDGDDEKWAEMVSALWFTPAQEAAQAERTRRYRERMAAVLKGELPKALPEGYHVSLYRRRFFAGDFPMDKKGLRYFFQRMKR